jgi:hypothetical protein
VADTAGYLEHRAGDRRELISRCRGCARAPAGPISHVLSFGRLECPVN